MLEGVEFPTAPKTFLRVKVGQSPLCRGSLTKLQLCGRRREHHLGMVEDPGTGE